MDQFLQEFFSPVAIFRTTAQFKPLELYGRPLPFIWHENERRVARGGIHTKSIRGNGDQQFVIGTIVPGDYMPDRVPSCNAGFARDPR